MDVKKRLQELMDARGWTIYRVAKEAGIPWSTVRNMFKRNTDPTIYTLELICNGMGITLAQFFTPDDLTGLPDEQRILLHRYNMLGERDRHLVAALLEALTEKRQDAAPPCSAPGDDPDGEENAGR